MAPLAFHLLRLLLGVQSDRYDYEHELFICASSFLRHSSFVLRHFPHLRPLIRQSSPVGRTGRPRGRIQRLIISSGEAVVGTGAKILSHGSGMAELPQWAKHT